MKKFGIAFLILFSMLLSNVFTVVGENFSQANAQDLQAKVKTKRIVEGTRFKMRLLNEVKTESNGLGVPFDATLTEDIRIENTIMLPLGSVIRGSISKYQAPERLSRGAVIYVDFDHAVTTEGRQLPLQATFVAIKDLTVDGGIIAGGNYGYAVKQNAKRSGQILKNCADWGIKIGEDKLGGYLQYVTTPITAFGGAVGAGAYFVGDSIIDLFRKGNEINIPAGTNFTVMLLQDLDVPVNY